MLQEQDTDRNPEDGPDQKRKDLPPFQVIPEGKQQIDGEDHAGEGHEGNGDFDIQKKGQNRQGEKNGTEAGESLNQAGGEGHKAEVKDGRPIYGGAKWLWLAKPTV